ncbi:DUF4190 domain-containing protein [uncultured Imperialibacter sp.]|uniref:DUF4190 domain-containing protein n=1 Tax=uncultured Imperialibacter sp. TaxID=1672639 RepID=UPI0030DA9CBC|tara:strand:+ start:260 stop:1009 length:750 start_codon:yes stop_codon:yes gene_type:complete
MEIIRSMEHSLLTVGLYRNEKKKHSVLNSLSKAASATLFILLAGLVTLSGCSTPKYYRFHETTYSSGPTAKTLDRLANKSPIVEHALEGREISLEGELFSTAAQRDATSNHSKKKLRKDIKMIVRGSSGWNEMASAKKATGDVTPSLTDNVAEEPPKKNKAAGAAFTMFIISMLSILAAIVIAPEFLFFLFLLIPATIYGYIGLKQIKETGESGKGKALFTAIFGTCVLLFVLIFMIYFELEDGEWLLW